MEPPKNLSARGPGRKFWRQVHSQYEVVEEHDLRLLEMCCDCLDKIADAEATIQSEGAYYNDRWNQPRQHPAHKEIKDNKSLFARLVREMGLNLEPTKSNTPPRLY
jgi:P27 family predicted phage terminase small subunit